MLMNRHHFFQSWQNATGSSDRKLKRTLLINELANIIVARPELAIGNLVKAGIDIKQDAEAAAIAKAYSDNLGKNKSLSKLTALEIMAQNKTSFDGKEYGQKFFNGDAAGSGGGSSVDYGSLASSLTDLTGSIIASSQAKKDRKKAEQEAKKAEQSAKLQNRLQQAVAVKQQQLMAKMQQMSAKNKPGKNDTWLWVGGILLGIGALSAALYYSFGIKSASAPGVPATPAVPSITPAPAIA